MQLFSLHCRIENRNFVLIKVFINVLMISDSVCVKYLCRGLGLRGDEPTLLANRDCYAADVVSVYVDED
ncbi:hypothetical protein B9Z55_014274 [Caenorhabditis nigoni]|uniref:Uncharacterized protein n=1 Tax=Caenorhabditis nigoni TaxID=1611254 RepID=A0A2G5U590_9PELO|nr:hypothetical protein B9Z55_014274 [Caenorhabditis nigoni]